MKRVYLYSNSNKGKCLNDNHLSTCEAKKVGG